MTHRVVNRIAFHRAPPVGAVLMIEGQRYVVIGTRPHVRLDGTPTTLITWRSHCAVCAQPFELVTGLRSHTPNRRCPKHHAPGLAVTAAGRERKRRYLAKRCTGTIAGRAVKSTNANPSPHRKT